MHAPNNGSGLTNASSATIVRDAGVGNGAVGNGIIVRDLVKTYIVADTDKDPLGLRGIKNTIRAVDGLNLTVPHKLLAVDLMDELDESARVWGAVNTVRFEGRGADGGWLPLGQWKEGEILEVRTRGFNTDADAITQTLREDLQCKPAAPA